MISEEGQNKVLSSKNEIDKCCYDHEPIAVCTYSSGRTWLVCNQHDQDEAFQAGRTSRTRLSL